MRWMLGVGGDARCWKSRRPFHQAYRRRTQRDAGVTVKGPGALDSVQSLTCSDGKARVQVPLPDHYGFYRSMLLTTVSKRCLTSNRDGGELLASEAPYI